VMGDLVFVTVTCENGGEKVPKRFIAKFSPQQNAPLPSFVIRSIFATEAHWYNDFLEEDGGLPRPTAYLTAAKLWRQRWWRRYPVFCMLLEQLPPPPYSRVSGCDSLPELSLVMQSLAGLHARWWGHQKAPPLEWVTHPGKDIGGLLYNGFVLATKVGFGALRRTYGDVYAPVLAWLPHIRRRHRYILDELFRPPLTLCHGDVHLDNMFFNEGFSTGIKAIDFGNMIFSQAMFDVAFFLGTNLDVPVRRKLEKELLTLYHSKLIEGGVKDYSFEQCWRDYRFNLWRPFINLLTIVPSFAKQKKTRTGMFSPNPTKADKQMFDMYERFNERLVAALVDHDWLELLLEGPARYGPCCGLSPCCT